MYIGYLPEDFYNLMVAKSNRMMKDEIDNYDAQIEEGKKYLTHCGAFFARKKFRPYLFLKMNNLNLAIPLRSYNLHNNTYTLEDYRYTQRYRGKFHLRHRINKYDKVDDNSYLDFSKMVIIDEKYMKLSEMSPEVGGKREEERLYELSLKIGYSEDTKHLFSIRASRSRVDRFNSLLAFANANSEKIRKKLNSYIEKWAMCATMEDRRKHVIYYDSTLKLFPEYHKQIIENAKIHAEIEKVKAMSRRERRDYYLKLHQRHGENYKNAVVRPLLDLEPNETRNWSRSNEEGKRRGRRR